MVPSDEGQYDVLTWEDFKSQYDIQSISILKLILKVLSGIYWTLLMTFLSIRYASVFIISYPNLITKPSFSALTLLFKS